MASWTHTRFFLVLLTSSLAMDLGCQPPTERGVGQGDVERATQAIAGGYDTTIEDQPWVVSINQFDPYTLMSLASVSRAWYAGLALAIGTGSISASTSVRETVPRENAQSSVPATWARAP
jgi:hypothetical protein